MESPAIKPSARRARRAALLERVRGPIVLFGNGLCDRNLPGYGWPFRQDSTFLYLIGETPPNAAAIVAADGCTLYLPRPEADDALWHGEVPSVEAIGARLGVDRVRPLEELPQMIGAATLAVADPRANARASWLTGRTLSFGRDHGDPSLVNAIIALRRVKSAAEAEEIRRIGQVTRRAFERVMAATRPGGSEQELVALFEGVLAATGNTTGYATILTQRGEVLHNHDHSGTLTEGHLLLLDGGGEAPSGYGCDITRTWPVSGSFDAHQRAAYEAVLAAQAAGIAACQPGTWYRDVHRASALVLAEFLHAEGILQVDPHTAVEIGAHALFFPHGVGHHLGLDVHDLENFGDMASYPPGALRSPQFGTRNLRLDLPLEEGWVVTVEPGFYVVPAILGNRDLRDQFATAVDWERAATWVGFGGIRIEDDVWITAEGPDVLTDVPKDPAAIEALVGTSSALEALR